MRELRLYKPNKSKQGSAASFQLAQKGKFKELMIFLTLARQGADDDKGNNSFGWKDKANSITVKISELDAAKMLTVLFGMETKLSLFHDSSKSGTAEVNQGMNRVVNFNKNDNGGYYLSVSSKQGEVQNKIQVSVGNDEAIQLKIFLSAFIERYYLGD